MKSVFILFDTLLLDALESYGGTQVKTPNFNRLAQNSIQFQNHYVGSLPCMPARRDIHTGRLNFMHRAWGGLEPFDNSWVRMLQKRGVHCHLITDHYHYFELGGVGYHNTFSTWDLIRGQEFDDWKALLSPPDKKFKTMYDSRHYPTDGFKDSQDNSRFNARKQHMINNEFIKTEEGFPVVKCFNKALDFLKTNAKQDDWVLWLECFDPHEPFHVPKRFLDKHGLDADEKNLNWPNYDKVTENEKDMDRIKRYYYALLDMCDEYLGKILDYFDDNGLWNDTSLILTTDHGYLLGEHEWWAKSRQPYYQEISHIPLFIYHPDYRNEAGSKRLSLTQTADIMPTILDMFGMDIPQEVQAKSLIPVIQQDKKIHDAVLFGMFGGPLGITDGKYVYFHFPSLLNSGEPSTKNLYEYTLMPLHMYDYFSTGEIQTMHAHEGFNFTKGMPVVQFKTYKAGAGRYHINDNLDILDKPLFDVESDPKQIMPLYEENQIARLKQEIVSILQNHDTPQQFYQIYAL